MEKLRLAQNILRCLMTPPNHSPEPLGGWPTDPYMERPRPRPRPDMEPGRQASGHGPGSCHLLRFKSGFLIPASCTVCMVCRASGREVEAPRAASSRIYPVLSCKELASRHQDWCCACLASLTHFGPHISSKLNSMNLSCFPRAMTPAKISKAIH